MMKCIAIDDEPLALEVIKKYAAETPSIKLMDVFTDAIQALSYLKSHKVDLIFLDIQMPDITGIQFFQSMINKPLVIFSTAYSEYAVKGFDLEAIDYLVKPIKYERFLKAITKAVKVFTMSQPANNVDDGFIFIKSEYQMIKISLNEILYVEGLDDYVKIHLQDEMKPILSLMSLKSLIQKLPEEQFMRVHRSFIVPLKRISSIRNKIIYLDKIKIPVGDTYFDVVQNWIAGH
jgi:two-component system, LytTR family, response regulator